MTFAPDTTTRPEPVLLTYYTVLSALSLVLFPFIFVPLYLRYHTLEYRFDEKGVAMSWGILFKREIYLTYRRIQDIHVSRNVIQRHLGLANVAVQTASGSSGAEMTIEGVTDPEGLRDYLYSRMRGASDATEEVARGTGEPAPSPDDEALVLLREIRDALAALRAERGAGSDRPESAP